MPSSKHISQNQVARSVPYDNSASDLTSTNVNDAIDEIDARISNPVDLTMANIGFEDFMFDAYAGAGGNDNQYSFTPAVNNGSSTIDGAVTVVGNDYEGIHTLDSLTNATSRPLLDGFASYNRIKLTAQQETYQIRVRINQLADVNQKFTARFGLLDGSAIGQPANGVLFSYDPVYPVTEVAQVVTVTPNSFPIATYQVVTGTPNVSSQSINQDFVQVVNSTTYTYQYSVNQVVTVTPNSFPQATYQVVTGTPTVSSQAPSQTFTQTINGSNYTYNYSTPQVVTVTPNSFPNATYQVVTVTVTAANNSLYTVTINGTAFNYTSDATATQAEIVTGLKSAINGGQSAVAATGTTSLILTSTILGTAFTYSVGTRLSAVLTTANVPKEIYTQTIAGVPYAFTSDGTPTASEEVAGLTALINADSGCPAIASGTTTLILTGKVSGNTWTYSGSSNLTEANTTATPVATTVVSALKTSINADGPLPVTASGTSTLILTSDILGTAFTYSSTANITDVLTTANVPIEVYTQTVNGTNYAFTSDGAPTATKVVTGLKALMVADPSVNVSGTTTLIITGKVAGVTFTYSGSSNLTETLSNPTLTAAIVVSGLTSIINADGSRVVQASGTTTLILTSNILGTAFTYSGTNITDALTTANVPREIYTQTINGVPYAFTSDGTPTAAKVVTGLSALINGDISSAVAATGTTTLILTADVAGTPFTYSGSSNLTEVLTTANVVGVAYLGNWIANVVNSSSTTAITSSVPIVAGQWYRIKAVMAAASSGVFFYVDDVQVAYITAPMPTAGLRFVFKLEKTLGTTSRSCDIDYVAWRRTRD